MEFIEVKEIPNIRRGERGNPRHGKLKEDLEEFMSLNIKYAEIIPDPRFYTSIHSLDNSMRLAIKRYNLPISTTVRWDTMYLIRTDL